MYFNERRLIVDTLPWMSAYEWHIENIMPNEIASFRTLLYPVDTYTWTFVFGVVVGEFALLIIMQFVWSYVAKQPTPQDFVYQGENVLNYTKGQNKLFSRIGILFSWSFISLTALLQRQARGTVIKLLTKPHCVVHFVASYNELLYATNIHS